MAEGAGLLNRYTAKSRIGGSNPPLSANFSFFFSQKLSNAPVLRRHHDPIKPRRIRIRRRIGDAEAAARLIALAEEYEARAERE